MITTPKDYYNLYHKIQSENPPTIAVLLPTDEKIYHVDLNTRTSEAPVYLSVEADHKSEVIYFTVDRFYDFYDLTEAVCVVQYKNAKNEVRAYAVPYYDIETFGKEDLILFPWLIDGEVTRAGGTVEFNIRFYKLSDTGSYYVYNISTLPARSKVLKGIDSNPINNLTNIGLISELTFNAYVTAKIPLYKETEKDKFIPIEVYEATTKYHINQEHAFLATLRDDIYQQIANIDDFDSRNNILFI